MLGKAGRPWKQPGTTVYRPEPVTTIEYDPETRKAVDTATGEYIIMRSGSRGGPGQIAYGTLQGGEAITGGWNSNWYPDEGVVVIFISALSHRTNYSKELSQADFDAAPIARMMVAHLEADRAADRVFGHISRPATVVVDNRAKLPSDGAEGGIGADK